MRKIHVLKILVEYYSAVVSGAKKFEIRYNDRDYKVGDILRLTEGTLAPVACLEKGAVPCERKSFCKTLPVWTKLDEIVENYLDSVTLADLIKS